jgi:hypothetical protein
MHCVNFTRAASCEAVLAVADEEDEEEPHPVATRAMSADMRAREVTRREMEKGMTARVQPQHKDPVSADEELSKRPPARSTTAALLCSPSSQHT